MLSNMDAGPDRTVQGSIELRRLGRTAFPTEELHGDDGLIAQLGRDGSLRIFFGRGRRIRLNDGTEWRIKSMTSGRHIVPVIRSSEGMVAISGPLYARRSYGLNGKEWGFSLIPLGKVGLRIPGLWVIRQHETEIAAIDYHERKLHSPEPLPLAAVLLAFALITHGIPGEADLMPTRDTA